MTPRPNPYVEELVPYEPGRPITDVAREYGLDPSQIAKLASNENPLGPSPSALQAIRDGLPHTHLYPDGGGLALRDAIAKLHGLTRDHVVPTSKGGRDAWENVVAACIHCNSRKGNRTPQQAGMPLLAIPFRPSWVEHLILSNRHILADQMAFLKAHLPKRERRAPETH